MYSPSKSSSHLCASNDDSSSDDASGRAAREPAIDYDRLPVPDEFKELFELVDAYDPVDLELETPLKCFLPSKYYVAVGDVDPFVKIPRPDGVPDGLGAAVLDEPVPANQSDAAAIELRLRNRSKTRVSRDAHVHSVENAAENADKIDLWIQSVEENNEAKPPPEARHRNEMPDVQELMQPWSKEMGDELRKGALELPGADIDLNAEEYARMMCSLLGIPVYDGHLVESVHVMLSLFVSIESQESNGDFA